MTKGSLYFPYSFVMKLVRSGVSVGVAINHHDLLPHINRFKECKTLINIDYHADLCGNSYEINCGTWGGYVEWDVEYENDQKSNFIWSYPEKSCCIGKTNLEGSGWCDCFPDDNPFFKRNPGTVCIWSNVHRRIRPILTKNELKNVAGIGICISPDFLHQALRTKWTRSMHNIMKQYDMENYSDLDLWDIWLDY